MRPQRILMEWPTPRLLKALRRVIDEQDFSPLRKRIMFKKLRKLALQDNLFYSNLDTEWLYRLCAASLMQHDYHWFAWEWRSEWATELATKWWCYPRWSGQPCRLLVVAEQGLGDEIVFASCYNELAADVEEALVEVDPRLIPTFERSFPDNLHFVSRFMDDKRMVVPRMGDYPKFHEGREIDAFIMAGNVPKLYRHSVDDFPKHGGFLQADARKVELARQWLSFDPNPIGCSWQGRQGEIEPIEGAISLQYGVENHRGCIAPPMDLKWDVDSVFALIKALGKVVTTTNAVAHMAGALGVSTDVIKPPPIYATEADGFNNRVSAFWSDDYSDWYPSVTMYRSTEEWKAKRPF